MRNGVGQKLRRNIPPSTWDREPVANACNFVNSFWFVQELEKLYMSIAGARKKKGTKFIECVSFCTFYYYYLI